MLWDYDFRLIPLTRLSPRSLRHPLTHVQNLLKTFANGKTPMRVREQEIAASALPAFQAAQKACFAAFSKTKAKTTTKTV